MIKAVLGMLFCAFKDIIIFCLSNKKLSIRPGQLSWLKNLSLWQEFAILFTYISIHVLNLLHVKTWVSLRYGLASGEKKEGRRIYLDSVSKKISIRPRFVSHGTKTISSEDITRLRFTTI